MSQRRINYSGQHSDSYHCSCQSHHHEREFICDRFLCDADFRLRLGGLQGGLNFRLRQLIGCNVRFELEEGKKLVAKIRFVGSDFVEIEVLKEKKKKDPDQKKKGKVKKKGKKKGKKKCKKNKCYKALIFPFESIKFIELKDDCHCSKVCKCKY